MEKFPARLRTRTSWFFTLLQRFDFFFAHNPFNHRSLSDRLASEREQHSSLKNEELKCEKLNQTVKEFFRAKVQRRQDTILHRKKNTLTFTLIASKFFWEQIKRIEMNVKSSRVNKKITSERADIYPITIFSICLKIKMKRFHSPLAWRKGFQTKTWVSEAVLYSH